MKKIKNLELLEIVYYGRAYYGADQAWYETHQKRYSGCGPTVCSNILWYLSRENRIRNLVPENGNDHDKILKLMNDVWKDVTPGNMGLNSTEMLKDGVQDYASRNDLSLDVRTLDIPQSKKKRPSQNEVMDFLHKAINDDLPIAFLNLSNGSLTNLESWHWVMLVGANDGKAIMYDQGKNSTVNIYKWLDTTLLGGGFVVIQPL